MDDGRAEKTAERAKDAEKRISEPFALRRLFLLNLDHQSGAPVEAPRFFTRVVVLRPLFTEAA